VENALAEGDSDDGLKIDVRVSGVFEVPQGTPEERYLHAFQQGKSYYDAREWEKAIQLWEAARMFSPGDRNLEEWIGVAQGRLGIEKQIRKDLTATVRSCRHAIAQRKFDEARSMLRQTLPYISAEYRLKDLEGQLAALNDHLDTIARKKAAATETEESDDTKGPGVSLWIYASAGMFILAGIALAAWVSWQFFSTSALNRQKMTQAQTLSAAGKWEDSSRVLNDYLARNPNDQKARNLLNWVELQIAQQQKEQQIESLLAKARAQNQRSDFAGAAETYQSLLRVDPVNQTARELLAKTQDRIAGLSREQKSRALLEKATLYYRNGQYQEASEPLNTILQSDPKNQEAAEMVRKIQAKKQEEVVRIENEASAAKSVELAKYLYQRGERESALTALNAAIAVDPSNSEALKLLNQIQAEPAPQLGTLSIETDLVAHVFIDGHDAGETPVVRKIKVGEHKVLITKDGYKPIYKFVTIKLEETTRLNLQLTKSN